MKMSCALESSSRPEPSATGKSQPTPPFSVALTHLTGMSRVSCPLVARKVGS